MHIFNKNNKYLINNYLYTSTIYKLITDYWSKIIFYYLSVKLVIMTIMVVRGKIMYKTTGRGSVTEEYFSPNSYQ